MPLMAARRVPGSDRSRRLALPALALVALTVVVYAGVWSFAFVQFDDPEYVFKNPNIAGGLTWAGIRWAFTTGYAANWHPLTWLSHMLDVRMFGLEPGPPHVVNLLLHIGNVVLLFWFLTEVTGSRGRSAVVAALFAAHPLHVESVAWVSERKDVLSTLFWMLTLCAYARYVRQPTRRRYLSTIAPFALGLLAKPMLVTLPCVLLLLDVWPLRRNSTVPDGGRVFRPGESAALKSRPPSDAETRSASPESMWTLTREKLPLFALAAASSVATILAQRGGGAVVALDTIPVGLRVENALLSYVDYLVKSIWPARLYMYYPHAVAVPVWKTAVCAALLFGITAAVLRARRTRPYLTVGWLWYVGTLVPVIGLVQVGRHWRHALQAATGLDERRTAIAVDDLLAENGVGPMQALLFTQGSAGSVGDAHRNLALALANLGRADDAIREFREVLRLKPDDANVRRVLDEYTRRGKGPDHGGGT